MNLLNSGDLDEESRNIVQYRLNLSKERLIKSFSFTEETKNKVQSKIRNDVILGKSITDAVYFGTLSTFRKTDEYHFLMELMFRTAQEYFSNSSFDNRDVDCLEHIFNQIKLPMVK